MSNQEIINSSWLVLRATSQTRNLDSWIARPLINKKQVIITNDRSHVNLKQRKTTLEALRFAKDQGALRVFQADASLHQPEDLNTLINALTEESSLFRCNLIIASRHLAKKRAKGLFALISRTENRFVSFILKTGSNDLTSTLRVWDKKAIGSINSIKTKGYLPEHLLALESTFLVKKEGLEIKEVPFAQLKTRKIGAIFFTETILYAILLKFEKPRRQVIEIARFLVVGLTGYILNLIAFSLLTTLFATNPFLSAFLAFLLSASYSFLGNKTWTFRSLDSPNREFLKFFIVSSAALSLNLVILEMLLTFLSQIPSQAIAIALVTPVNFLGNKLWTFKARRKGD